MGLDTLREDSEIKKLMVDALENPDDTLVFLRYDENFLNPDYRGPHEKLNQWVIRNKERAFRSLFGEACNVHVDELHDAAGDIFLPQIIVNLWASDKQVYQFDPELELSLADMEEVQIPVEILDRLPYRTFYIEFAEDGIFRSNFHGAFLHFAKFKDGYIMFILRVTEDGKAMSGSVAFVPDDNDRDEPVFLVNKNDDIDSTEENSHIDWKDAGVFLINAVLYLCSENAQIQENAITKQTYKKPKTIKNKFSEVKKYDCGFVYGETIRRNQLESQKSEAEESSSDPLDSKERSKGYKIRPHTRKAHWHHYWVGKGRTELVLRWIAPTTIGTGEKIATIHKCL